MSSWKIEYTEDAQNDLRSFDHSVQVLILKNIAKVAQNPLPNTEGGYGKPLGNTGNTHLSGLLKIKLRSNGIRIVYQLVRTETAMKVIVIALRDDNQVYKIAHTRQKSC